MVGVEFYLEPFNISHFYLFNVPLMIFIIGVVNNENTSEKRLHSNE